MDFVNLINLMIDCNDAGIRNIMVIIGWVIWGIKVVVPIILIIMGMLDMAKAVTEKSEDKIKEAQHKLITKAIAAVIVFLIPTIVGLLMGVLGANDYKGCVTCINSPGTGSCVITLDIQGN